MLRDTCHGGTRCPQRVGETDAASPPVICAFSESFAIGPSRTGIFGEADPPIRPKYETVRAHRFQQPNQNTEYGVSASKAPL
jgi:hypothetical protein